MGQKPIHTIQKQRFIDGGGEVDFRSHEIGLGECKLPNCAQTTDMAPSFTAEAYDNIEKKMKEVRLESYRGQWMILFFYGSDFTFV